jgi:hypothetical protein
MVSVLASTGIILAEQKLFEELFGFFADAFFAVIEPKRLVSEHDWLDVVQWVGF